jgi:hypothetical protein
MGENLPRVVHNSIAINDDPLNGKFHRRWRLSHHIDDCFTDLFAATKGSEVMLNPKPIDSVKVSPSIPVATVTDRNEVVVRSSYFIGVKSHLKRLSVRRCETDGH